MSVCSYPLFPSLAVGQCKLDSTTPIYFYFYFFLKARKGGDGVDKLPKQLMGKQGRAAPKKVDLIHEED